MKCVVISQPMYFPWPGLLEQYRLADEFVYYDDVQFSKGSFTNRVQIKTAKGIKWLTTPLHQLNLGQLINEAKVDNRKNWKRSQRDQLAQAYKHSAFRKDMLDIVDEVFVHEYDVIGDLALASTEALVAYFPSLRGNATPKRSSIMEIIGSGSQRVIDLCKSMNASVYLTGHGARHYLDHERFEALGIDVSYINYSLTQYPQQHGRFTPYVSTLDLIANCGPAGVECIRGEMIPWRTFIERAAHPENPS